MTDLGRSFATPRRWRQGREGGGVTHRQRLLINLRPPLSLPNYMAPHPKLTKHQALIPVRTVRFRRWLPWGGVGQRDGKGGVRNVHDMLKFRHPMVGMCRAADFVKRFAPRNGIIWRCHFRNRHPDQRGVGKDFDAPGSDGVTTPFCAETLTE